LRHDDKNFFADDVLSFVIAFSSSATRRSG
jgi:hypothetical protein